MSGGPGYFFHPPGALSRWGVLDLGRRCAHSCRFCYYSFMAAGQKGDGGQFDALRRAPFRSTADSLAILDRLAGHGLVGCDITGGEPTLHEGLPDMVRRAAGLGLAVRVITLGQFLLGRDGGHLLDRLLAAGVTDFLFSIHAASEEGFRAATGGSLGKVLAAMAALDGAGFQYGANTVVHAGNLDDLPRIAEIAAAHGVYHHNFIVFNAYHRWDTPERIAGMQAAYPAMATPLRRAVDILTRAGVAVTLRYLPLCVVPDLARHVVGVVGVHHDPHEWMNRAGNEDRDPEYCAEPLPVPPDGPRDIYALVREARRLDFAANGSLDTVARRGEAFKVFPQRCAVCPGMDFCDGVDPKYLRLHGEVDLSPLAREVCAGPAAGPLLACRRAYLPAFAVKTAPFADVRGAIAKVLGRLPLPGAPTIAAFVAPGVPAAVAATMAALGRQRFGALSVTACAAGASPGAALNTAAKNADGTVFAFFQAGVTPDADVLARCVDLLDGRPELSLVRCGGGAEPDFAALRAGDATPGGVVLRREAFTACGGFAPGLADCLFWDFRLAAAAAGHFGDSLPGEGERAGTASRVDAGHPEFPEVVRRNRQIFPRETVLALAKPPQGMEERT